MNTETSIDPLAGAGEGNADFISTHSAWTEEQADAAKRLIREVEDSDLRQIRVSWGDQHGILRGKTLSLPSFVRALRNGIDFQSAVLAMDTTNNIFVPLFAGSDNFGIDELKGYPDAVLVPDPLTFQILPWASDTGWVLSDMYFSNGRPVPFCTRRLFRTQLDSLREAGYEYVAGLEVEFYITKLEDAKLEAEQCGYPPDPPRVSALAHGFQYLTENRGDEIDDILQYLSQTLERIGVPVRSMEDEWGPGQVEITFDPRPGLEAADALLLFRTAVKQICRRRGLHATFMARPGLPNFFSSGWHLHQSLNEVGQDRNAFTRYGEGEGPISAVARSFAAGILQYADASAVFTNPTVTGYKRFQPNSFAPTKATWAYENRGAMIRVIGAPEDSGTHIENRIGEPAANPYLYMGSQVAAGLAGIERKLDPGPFDESPYESDKPNVPASLIDAVNALERDDLYRERFGSGFVDYMVAMKRSEWSRFLSHVTDWEHREYFEVF